MSSGPHVGAAELVDLAVGGEQPCPVGAQLARLPEHAELDREPEHGGEEPAPLWGLQAPGGVPGQAVELGQARAGQHPGVPDDFVDEVGLGRVEGPGVVADVLGGVKDAVRQRPVELLEAHEPGCRVIAKAGERCQARAHLIELGDVIGGQGQASHRLAVFRAGQTLVLDRQLAAHGAPDALLGVGVLDSRALAGRASNPPPARRCGCGARGRPGRQTRGGPRRARHGPCRPRVSSPGRRAVLP